MGLALTLHRGEQLQIGDETVEVIKIFEGRYKCEVRTSAGDVVLSSDRWTKISDLVEMQTSIERADSGIRLVINAPKYVVIARK